MNNNIIEKDSSLNGLNILLNSRGYKIVFIEEINRPGVILKDIPVAFEEFKLRLLELHDTGVTINTEYNMLQTEENIVQGKLNKLEGYSSCKTGEEQVAFLNSNTEYMDLVNNIKERKEALDKKINDYKTTSDAIRAELKDLSMDYIEYRDDNETVIGFYSPEDVSVIMKYMLENKITVDTKRICTPRILTDTEVVKHNELMAFGKKFDEKVDEVLAKFDAKIEALESKNTTARQAL